MFDCLIVTASPSAAYTLSLCLGHSDVVHYSIVRNLRGDLSVSGHDHSFLSLADLVAYFRRNRSGLACRLTRALRDVGRPLCPGVDYPRRCELARADVVVGSRPVGVGTDLGGLGKGLVGQYRGREVVVRVMRPSPEMLHRPDVNDDVDDQFLAQVTTIFFYNNNYDNKYSNNNNSDYYYYYY